ncbi:NAD(P)H:quinone oxidoreductase [Legionella londiniensis]|uniref:NAD(P)H dehydrogenase (quinone) n=1 Tax=Legionella londiniensis TaxID=45068 RepID=A0A0W0VJ41_9GAMM|nr:NAD(P)H:quinone oxidoreductase [Legionella londiniensis]KTD19901.1 flavoprotein WrbA (Trp repressor binding protein) [Legionella londiniensis]STX94227.1 flavoprotein WrbA (Trp repressor binding protein) [Legionella londiniensis]
MTTKIQIIFYSMYGHVYQMAEAIKEGAQKVSDVEALLFQVPELVPEEVLEKSGAKKARSQFSHIPVAKTEQLTHADAIIFGTPTRYGNMCSQMRNFLDQTGGLWMNDSLVGKVASVFCSTATQHGGQETTLTSFHTTLFHLGFIVVGLPYSEKRILNMDEITGGTPYGATTLAGAEGTRKPSENELGAARFQGQHVAQITKALKLGRNKL